MPYPTIDIGKYTKEEWRERVREQCPWVSDALFEEFWQELSEEKQKKADREFWEKELDKQRKRRAL